MLPIGLSVVDQHVDDVSAADLECLLVDLGELVGRLDEDEYDFVGMDFDPPVDIPANAESHGARGHLVETPDEFPEVYEKALEASGTDVIDVLVHD